MAKKKTEVEAHESYFLTNNKQLQFINTGCLLLNKVLGGGWPLGRISNVVGDFSSGKTLLAIEAIVNFYRDYPTGQAYYIEGEAAFDAEYAEELGLPLDKVNFVDSIDTVESMYAFVLNLCKDADGKPLLVIVDSLDSLSDEAERKEEDITKGTFGAAKAKQLSKIFRLITKKISQANMHLMIISQVRDNIGVMFGNKHTRAAGKALNFYASLIVWLAQVEQITKTVKGVKRPYGIWIKAKCTKNKISMPFRECQFPIIFSFGIQEMWACLEWLSQVDGALAATGFEKFKSDKELEEYANSLYEHIDEENWMDSISAIYSNTAHFWNEVEKGFMPTIHKY
jgi:recombination protein RecA